MNILFVHQNFPGQFKSLAPALVRLGHTVVATTMQKVETGEWNGVRLVPYAAARGSSKNIHPWAADVETKTIRAEACFRAALKLREEGFFPDAIIAHPGWGESLFLKEVWPDARLAIYCEYFYKASGGDYGFDSEFESEDPGDKCRLAMKNVNNLLHFEIADAAISPTYWQASTFPERFREKIEVIHDGIDTRVVKPDSTATITLNDGTLLGREDEIITFVNRNLEPSRGYHVFMRALPEIMARRPGARVLIVGGKDVSYGARSNDGRSWAEVFAAEIRSKLPDEAWSRIYFLGQIPYRHYLAMLRISTVHVYLTYPFVLSWSLLEAMASGCAIVASATPPVQEAISDGQNGRLVDFFDTGSLAGSVCSLLDQPEERLRLGMAARDFAVRNYDLNSVCLPRQLAWVDRIFAPSAE